MLKRSRKVAVLAVCVMMFGVVQPAFAWGNRTGSREGDAVAYGAGAGTAAAIGAAALIFFTGGLATPFVVGAAAVAGVAGAAGGVYYGYNVEEKSLAKDTGVLVGAGAFGAGAGVVAGAAAAAAGGVVAGGGAVAGGAATGGAGATVTIGKIAGGLGTAAIGGTGGVVASQQKSSSNGYSHTPINGHGGTWAGERGNSNWIMDENTVPANKLYNPEKLTWNEINAKYRNDIKNIPYKNGEPDFSEVAVGTVKINNFTDKRYQNFKNADQVFADQLNREHNLSGTDQFSAKDIETFRKDNNLTWHEHKDRETMVLLPREYHSLPHSGGISDVKKLNK